MTRHARGRSARLARAIGRLGTTAFAAFAPAATAAIIFAAAAIPARATPPDPDERADTIRALADSVLDADGEVAAAAAQTLLETELAVGEPIEIVARWASERAPRSRFALGIARALREADQRWPADTLLVLVDRERRAAAPALPPALLELAATLLRPQSHSAAPPQLTSIGDVADRPGACGTAAPPPLLAPPTAIVEDELLARLRAADPVTVADAWEEFERTTAGRPLPAALLPTLVELAMHGPESVRKRAVWRFTDALAADPAPLAEWWRFRHATAPCDAARLALLVELWGERALPVLATIADEGGGEDRAQVMKVLADAATPFGEGPFGDELLLATLRRDGAAHRARALAALARHPAVAKRELERLHAWLATPEWREVVAAAAVVGEDAAPLLPAILARAERDGVALARIARPLAHFGPAAIEPLAQAFDEATDASDQVELAAALLLLDVRRDEALAAERDALDARDGAVRRAAWIELARAFGVVRPG